MAKAMDKVRVKAEAIANQSDVSEGLKIKEIQKLYKRQYA